MFLDRRRHGDSLPSRASSCNRRSFHSLKYIIFNLGILLLFSVQLRGNEEKLKKKQAGFQPARNESIHFLIDFCHSCHDFYNREKLHAEPL